MVMLSVGQAVALTLRSTCPDASDEDLAGYNAALMLGIAYAATIGGMGSLIGTPPNALFAAYMAKEQGIEIGFARWMLIGLPIVAVLLPITWLLLTRVVFRVPVGRHGAAAATLKAELAGLPKLAGGERRVALLMLATALSWLLRPAIGGLVPGLPLSDAGIAVVAAALAFLIRVEQRPLITWREAMGINWGVLVLFGGGLALAGAIDHSGLATWIADKAVILSGLPWIAIVGAVAVVMVGVGELASNTAMAAVFLPVAGAAAVGMGVAPLALALPVALSASLGFMLPVATPPNAIVFSSRAVSARQMLKAGVLLDAVSIVVVVAMASVLGPLVFALG
jgi:sodium-dependent dicarboxylate transporter 2/3/5